MNRFSFSIIVGLSLLVGAPTFARANELFAAAPLDQVSIRTIPAFNVVQTDTVSSLDAGWTKGFRLGARYAAYALSSLNTPTIITFPDWDKNPTADGDAVHLQVQCILDPIPGLPRIRDHDATIESMPGMTVACYALTGAYTPANFLLSLKKIQDHLLAHHLAAVGPPRYLFYTDTTWLPSWWRVGEVQVPIAPGGGN